MSFLKTTYEQFRDIYLGLTPGLRVVAGLLAGVLVVSILFLVSSRGNVTPKAKDTFTLNGHYFTSSQQQAVASALSNEGISNYSWEGGRLKVPVKQEATILAAISKHNAMPRDAMSAYVKWFQETSTLESQNLMKNRKEASKAAAVVSALENMGLEQVTVIPDTKLVRKKGSYEYKEQTSVSISFLTKPGESLDRRKLGAITGQVQGAFNIDDPSLIYIINLDPVNGGTYQGDQEWFMNSEGGGFLVKQMEAEQKWEMDIRKLFPNIEGLVVKTSVQLDPRKNVNTLEVKHDDKKPTSTIYDKQKSFKEEGEGHPHARRPGYEMQDNTPLPLNNGWGYWNGKYSGKYSDSESIGALQGETSTYDIPGYVPQSISASIQVPRDYFRSIWIQNHQKRGEETPEPTPEELTAFQTVEIEQMRQAVFTLISNQIPQEYRANLDINEKVFISTFDRIADSPEAALTFSETLIAWFSSNWKTMALFVLIFSALYMLWAVSKPAKPEPIIIYEAPEVPLEETFTEEGEEAQTEEEIELQRTLEPFNKSMRSLQEEVSDLVAENPDAAANVLRQWIGKVAFQEH